MTSLPRVSPWVCIWCPWVSWMWCLGSAYPTHSFVDSGVPHNPFSYMGRASLEMDWKTVAVKTVLLIWICSHTEQVLCTYTWAACSETGIQDPIIGQRKRLRSPSVCFIEDFTVYAEFLSGSQPVLPGSWYQPWNPWGIEQIFRCLLHG